MLFSKVLFLKRYLDLRERIIPQRIEGLSTEELRLMPQNRNSALWLYWHILRTEDVGISGFILQEKQVYEDWGTTLNLETTLNGTGMNLEEVREISNKIDIENLKAYSQALKEKTIYFVEHQLLDIDLSALISRDYIDQLIEKTMPPHIWPLKELYYDKTKEWFLLHVCLTHPFYHLGQISIIQQLNRN